jgi:sulfoxide reductase heme-binding subunit YedZ
MTSALGSIGPSVYWYVTRSTGVVSLLLLTATMVLGVIDVTRWSTPGWPRFVLDSLHRSVSLLVIVFLGAHILTAVLDSFAPISLLDALLPFLGSYRPLWLGLGTVAFDLLIAVAVTSLMRQRLGHRAWRITHWLAYACWPIALLHGLGTGSDVKSAWSLVLTGACVLAVAAAVCVRVLRGWPERRTVRGGALALTALLPVALIAWLPGGPLDRGWARSAGTPASLLGSSARATVSAAAQGASSAAGVQGSHSSSLAGPFDVRLSGTITEGPGPRPGWVAVKIAASFSGTVAGRLDLEIDGQSVGEGGVSLRSSNVTLGSPPTPEVYRGKIVALNGNRLLATVRNDEGRNLSLQVVLAIDSANGTVRGTLAASPTTGAHG